MAGIVDAIEAKINEKCKANKIRRGNCRIDVPGEHNHWVVIDFDKPDAPLKPNEIKPDFLFVSSSGGGVNGRIVPIEISQGKSKSANKISRQLQAGADWVDREIAEFFQPKLVPVYCGPIKKFTRNNIRRSRIKFRGQKEVPKVMSRKGPLPE